LTPRLRLSRRRPITAFRHVLMTDDDGKVVEQAAREFVDQYGADAIRVLRERAEVAETLKDELAAKAWRDIAGAAEQILRAD
jgi:hypothetical protein